jgi:hypothetical protein
MPMYDETVDVIENRVLTGGHFLLSLDAPRQAPAVRPGQSAMVRILGRSDVLLRGWRIHGVLCHVCGAKSADAGPCDGVFIIYSPAATGARNYPY